MEAMLQIVAQLKDQEREYLHRLVRIRRAINVLTSASDLFHAIDHEAAPIVSDPAPASPIVPDPVLEDPPEDPGDDSKAKGSKGICANCSAIFIRIRKDQSCCSSNCRSMFELKKAKKALQDAKLADIRKEIPVRRGRPKVERGLS